MSESIQSNIVGILADILAVPREAVKDEFSPESCETWDSVRQLMIVLALEEKFRIVFAESEVSALDSFAKISATVAAKLLARKDSAA
jgi:acyl carrier protein